MYYFIIHPNYDTMSGYTQENIIMVPQCSVMCTFTNNTIYHDESPDHCAALIIHTLRPGEEKYADSEYNQNRVSELVSSVATDNNQLMTT